MSGAQAAMADVLLRGTGGRTVQLRVPSPAMAGDVGEQVGLGTPRFQDMPLGPVVFRRVMAGVSNGAVQYELLVSCSAVERLVGSLQFDSASVLFRDAFGVLVDGVLLTIDAMTAAESFGTVYLYRLKLTGAQALLA